MPSAATVYPTLNLTAITSAALAGSTAARRRGLDPVGIRCCACSTGLHLVARRRHRVLPPVARSRARTPGEAPAASAEPARPAPHRNTPTQAQGEPDRGAFAGDRAAPERLRSLARLELVMTGLCVEPEREGLKRSMRLAQAIESMPDMTTP